MYPKRRHPSAASTIAVLLENDPKRIALFVAGLSALGGALWWYDTALSAATGYEELRRLVYGGLAALTVSALAVAAGLLQLGRASISQEIFPPRSRIAVVLLRSPGELQLAGRHAVRRGWVMIGAACGICLWIFAVLIMMRHIESSLTRAHAHTPRDARVSASPPRAHHRAPPQS